MRSLPPNWGRRFVTVSPTCEVCGGETAYADSVPDATVEGTHPSECGYRLKALCWLHGAERRKVATSRIVQVVLVGPEVARVGYLDRDRASGECLCPECGRKYYDHPPFPDHPYLNQLCDGSAVKL